MGLKTLFTQAFPQVIKDYYDALIVTVQTSITSLAASKENIFNASNVATGTNSVTLNTTSGVITYTDVNIGQNDSKDYTLTNSNLTVNSIINVFTFITSNDDSTGAIVMGITCSNGSCIIRLFNPSISATPITLKVAFKIVA
jgi:hypothetical protein